MSDSELTFVRSLKRDQREISRGQHVVRAGDNGDAVYTLFSGWAYRYLLLGDNRRQILDILLPGDLIGLQSPWTGKVRHSVSSITPISLCILDGPAIGSIFQVRPVLATALMQTLLLDESRSDRRLLLLGRQRATERLAYLMLELHERLVARDMATDTACPMPLTYEQMADSVGISRAQLARGLKDLRDAGWLRIANAEAIFSDIAAMSKFSSYISTPDDPRRSIV